MKTTAKPVSEKVKKGVFYQIFLRAFTSEGTIAAAKKMLPEIADLGVSFVYLCPINEADDDMRKEYWSTRQLESGFENPKNPYRIKDYFKIDEEYGNECDLHEFVECAHSLGIHVLLDIVYLHCGPTAEIIEKYPDFIKRDNAGNILYNDWHFPTINFDNFKLREYLWNNMEYFVKEFNIDGYRCDVGDRVPLDFWIEARKRIETIKPSIVMLNEGVNGEFLEEAFDLNYSFGFASALTNALSHKDTAQKVREIWEETYMSYPENGRCIRYMDNHDTASDSYKNRYEKCMGYGGIEAGFVTMFTLDGVPMLYNGNEVCDDSRHSLWSNRNFGKLYINWENAMTPKGQKRREFLKKLIAMRTNTPALYEGSVRWLDNSVPDKVLSYVREYQNQKIMAVINTSDTDLTVIINQNTEIKKDILNSGVLVNNADGKLSVQLPPKGYIVFQY